MNQPLHAPAPGQPTVDVITDSAGLYRLRDEWTALVDSRGRWNPFVTWEWMDAWWTHLRGTAALHLITVRSTGTLIGIAPLVVVRRGLSTPPQLEFLGAGAAGADYLDVIARPGEEAAAIEAIVRALDLEPRTLHLDHLPPESTASRLGQSLAGAGWTSIHGSPDVCPIVELSGHTWDSYLASLGSSHRANVRRRERALHAGFTVRFARVDDQDDRRAALDALFAFHDHRWAGGASTAFATPPLRAFHHHLTRAALDQGWLRLFTLALDGRLAAVMYGFARDGRFYFYQHGHDRAEAARSLGLVLMAQTIRAAIDDGVTTFDMLYGHEAYKQLWTRRQRPLERLMLFPPRLAGRWQQRRVETRLAVRAFARRIGLKGSHGTA